MQVYVQAAQNGHRHKGFDRQLEVLNRVARQVQFDNLVQAREVIWKLSDFIVAKVNLKGKEKDLVEASCIGLLTFFSSVNRPSRSTECGSKYWMLSFEKSTSSTNGFLVISSLRRPSIAAIAADGRWL